jgi:CBS domain-containing protein
MNERTMDGPGEAAATVAFLRRHAPFDGMNSEDVAFLAERLRPIRFPAGEAVIDPDAGPAEWFYVLQEGRIVGEDHGEGEPLAGSAWELSEGDSFPIAALVENRPVRNVQRADEDAVCLFTNRESFDELRRRSDIFDEFCSSRLSGLLSKVNRQVQAEAVRDLGDSSLNIALSERPLRPPVTASPSTRSPRSCA